MIRANAITIRTMSTLCICAISFHLHADRVAVGADLTKGDPQNEQISVKGGNWDNGWRITQSGDLLLFDAGYTIKNGYCEAVFTTSSSPPSNNDKVNWFGVYESRTLNQATEDDKAFIRTGKANYNFGKLKVSGKAMNSKPRRKFCVEETTIGSRSDWITDDRTTHTLTFFWKDGRVSFEAKRNDGKIIFKKRDITMEKVDDTNCIEKYPVDALRYGVVGNATGHWKGMRVLHMRIVDTDKSPGDPSGVSPRTPVHDVAPVSLIGRSSVRKLAMNVNAATGVSVHDAAGRHIARLHELNSPGGRSLDLGMYRGLCIITVHAPDGKKSAPLSVF